MPKKSVSDTGFVFLKNKYKIDTTTGCWNWIAGCVSKGRPSVWNGKTMAQAHRVSYMQTKGKIPEGYDLHHICKNIKCINPNHLEPIKHEEHKGTHHLKTHCARGHEFTQDNSIILNDGYRRCKKCKELDGETKKLVDILKTVSTT